MEKIFGIAAALGYGNLRHDILDRELAALPPQDCGKWALFVQEHMLPPGGGVITGIETGTFDPAADIIAYPSSEPCRLERGPSHTFLYGGEAYMKRGTVITNASVSIGSEVFGRFVPFGQNLSDKLTLRIGTQASPIGRLSDNRLILRSSMVYTAIGTLRALGCGIITNENTRMAAGIFIIEYESPRNSDIDI